MAVVVSRFDVCLVNLAPALGVEIQKPRPCVIISPDEMNRHIGTAIVAPITPRGRRYPSRVACKFGGIDGQFVLDQIQTVDKARLVKKSGRLNKEMQGAILGVLTEMFAK